MDETIAEVVEGIMHVRVQGVGEEMGRAKGGGRIQIKSSTFNAYCCRVKMLKRHFKWALEKEINYLVSRRFTK